MIRLYDNDSDAEIGEITEDELSLIQENLVEESLDDYSYSISEAAINVLEAGGANRRLIEVLRRALAGRSSIDVRYELD
ncbi:MAG: galactosyldiacylglycerol synthase [Acidobacteriota bacterium]